jgi:ankyrin repeat protein
MQRDPRPWPGPFTERTFAEIARPYQVRTKGRRTFETLHSRDNGKDGDTVLHKAAAQGAIQDVLDLLRLGAEVDAPGDMGDAPLHAAARNGHARIVDILVEARANITIRNEFGETPVEAAARNGFEDLARMMRQGAKRP